MQANYNHNASLNAFCALMSSKHTIFTNSQARSSSVIFVSFCAAWES